MEDFEFDIDISKIFLFSWQELYYYQFQNEIGLEAFKLLNSNQEEALATTKRKFEETIKNDADLKAMDEENWGNYYSQLYEREETTIQELQRVQRYSICLSLFSFFEGRLKAICESIEKEFDAKIKIDDLSGKDDVMRYWNYLVKVYEVDISHAEKFFTPIRQHKQVRNLIAHYNGYTNAETKNKLEPHPGLAFTEVDENVYQLQIKKSEYFLFLIEKMETFLNEILDPLDKRYEQKKRK